MPYGQARVFGCSGTVTFSGQPANTEWTLTELRINDSFDITRTKGSSGNFAQAGDSGRMVHATAKIIAEATSGANTAANGKAAPVLLAPLTVCTITAADLPTIMTGDWNYEGAEYTGQVGEFIALDLKLSRVWTGSAYAAMTAVA